MSTTPLEEELRVLLNRHSMENTSDTPDFILASYLLTCLDAFDAATLARDIWHGRHEEKEVWPDDPKPL